ncbi:MAG: Holliday junction resolvase RuvX [Actinomycetota bacterium]|nr:Holliday junction resolvase RuvX [Actinomycetota bacterium]
MRIVGLDLGSRRIGVAVSDSGGVLATPYSVIERSGDPAADRARIADVVQELEAGTVVVGLPLSLDGSRGPAATAAVAEVDALREVLDVPVEVHDERLSTVSAHRSLTASGLKGSARRRKVVDQVAASVVLQSWLDRGATR